MVMLSFLRRLNVRRKKNNRLNTPAFARTNVDWPKITLIIAVDHAMQSRNNRILSMFIWNEEGMAEAVYGYQKTGFNPFSQTTFNIKEEWLFAAIMKWRHFLFRFKEGNWVKERNIFS